MVEVYVAILCLPSVTGSSWHSTFSQLIPIPSSFALYRLTPLSYKLIHSFLPLFLHLFCLSFILPLHSPFLSPSLLSSLILFSPLLSSLTLLSPPLLCSSFLPLFLPLFFLSFLLPLHSPLAYNLSPPLLFSSSLLTDSSSHSTLYRSFHSTVPAYLNTPHSCSVIHQ